PDGKHFLYLATNHQGGSPAENGIYYAGLDGKDVHQVVASDSGAEVAEGYLLYHTQPTLMAQPFDAASGTVSGEAVAILDKVKFDTGVWRAIRFGTCGSWIWREATGHALRSTRR